MNTRATLLATLALGLATAGASAQITGSAHDFSSAAWNTSGEICLPCHTPHNAAWQNGRLWNHAMSDPATQYNLYNSGTTGTTSTNVAFDSSTKLCLSCHDGTVAIDSFGGASGTTFMTGDALVGTDLRNDHPIGSKAIYPLAGASTSFHDQNASHQVVSAAGTLRLRSWTDPADSTVKYVVGCKTCHNPHRTPGADHLLAFSNTSSQLCLACHIK